jgi:hypothetical protein
MRIDFKFTAILALIFHQQAKHNRFKKISQEVKGPVTPPELCWSVP